MTDFHIKSYVIRFRLGLISAILQGNRWLLVIAPVRLSPQKRGRQWAGFMS
jgi:hypothetical protein